MDELWRIAAWVALAGAAGGALNAAFSDNRDLLPSRVLVGAGTHVLRPGLALSLIVGSCSSVAALSAFAGVACARRTEPSSLVLLSLAAALLVGVLSARWLSSDADKRLLRAATRQAAAAPAAHPDAVAEMERATPHQLFIAATRLIPQHRRSG